MCIISRICNYAVYMWLLFAGNFELFNDQSSRNNA